MPRFPSKHMPRSTYDAETERLVERDRNRKAREERLADAVPHRIVFADGCSTWLGYRREETAVRALDRILESTSRPDLWAGAQVVPYRRERDGLTYTDYHADTGEALPRWRDCPDHDDRFPPAEEDRP